MSQSAAANRADAVLEAYLTQYKDCFEDMEQFLYDYAVFHQISLNQEEHDSNLTSLRRSKSDAESGRESLQALHEQLEEQGESDALKIIGQMGDEWSIDSFDALSEKYEKCRDHFSQKEKRGVSRERRRRSSVTVETVVGDDLPAGLRKHNLYVEKVSALKRMANRILAEAPERKSKVLAKQQASETADLGKYHMELDRISGHEDQAKRTLRALDEEGSRALHATIPKSTYQSESDKVSQTSSGFDKLLQRRAALRAREKEAGRTKPGYSERTESAVDKVKKIAEARQARKLLEKGDDSSARSTHGTVFSDLRVLALGALSTVMLTNMSEDDIRESEIDAGFRRDMSQSATLFLYGGLALGTIPLLLKAVSGHTIFDSWFQGSDE